MCRGLLAEGEPRVLERVEDTGLRVVGGRTRRSSASGIVLAAKKSSPATRRTACGGPRPRSRRPPGTLGRLQLIEPELQDWRSTCRSEASSSNPSPAAAVGVTSRFSNDAGWLSAARTSRLRSSTCCAKTGSAPNVVDPPHNDLNEPARPDEMYAAIWASACLLHLQRADLRTVLKRLPSATRPRGDCFFSV